MAWWNADKGAQLDEAVRFADGLRSRQYRTARARAQAALFLYRGSTRIRLNGAESSFWGRDLEEVPPHNNVIRSAVDWFTAIMVRNKVRPFLMTIKGNAEARAKCEGLQRAIDGTMSNLGIYGELGALRCRDGHWSRAPPRSP